MKKRDLIIDALECASARENMDLEVKARYEIEDIDLITKALAAARELRELKPVAFCALTPNGMMGYFDGKPMIMVGKVGNDCHTTPLYSLDGVRNEQE